VRKEREGKCWDATSRENGISKNNKKQTQGKAYCEYYANWSRQSKWTPRFRHVVVPKDAVRQEKKIKKQKKSKKRKKEISDCRQRRRDK